MSYYLYLLNSHRHVLNNNIIKLLLDSLVQSHMYYSLLVWGPSLSLQLSSRLKRLQNRAVHLAFSLKRYDHVSEYYKQLNWLPLDQFIKFCSICSMYKQFHQRCCIPFEPPIQFGQSHSHYTRTSLSFARIVRYKLNFSQRFFHYRVTQPSGGTLYHPSLPISLLILLLMQSNHISNIVTPLVLDFCCIYDMYVVL